MKFIIGRKLNMSQVFAEDGTVTPVTIVAAEPCVVTRVKNAKKDGYTAVQIGYGAKKVSGKSVAGQFKGLGPIRGLKEFRLEGKEADSYQPGMTISTDVFAEGDVVKVTGTSKGKGFAGVVKRHGFHGQSTSHGVKDQVRMPGSSGAGGNQHTFKGVKKPGHMGSEQVTIANLQIVKNDLEQGLLYVKGAIPGARNGVVWVYGEGVMTLEIPSEKVEVAVNAEAAVEAPVEVVAVETPVEATVEEVKATPAEVVVEAPAEKSEELVAKPETANSEEDKA